MAMNTEIAWANDTANLWWGCVEVHPGCDNCYAHTLDGFRGGGISHWGNDVPRLIIKGVWAGFTKSQKMAVETGVDRRVFVGSMMDIFERSMPLVDRNGVASELTTGDLRNRYFEQEVPHTPNLLHLMLTKRPSNIKRMIPPAWLEKPLGNVMYGYSAVDQPTTDGIRHLVDVPGRHFLSCEPLLGHIDLVMAHAPFDARVCEPGLQPVLGTTLSGIDWVIVGGESGSHARPMHPAWARSLRDQCADAGVPYFFKQWGEWLPYAAPRVDHDKLQAILLHEDGTILNQPTWTEAMDSTGPWQLMYKVGKHTAGRLLDGTLHSDVPEIIR